MQKGSNRIQVVAEHALCIRAPVDLLGSSKLRCFVAFGPKPVDLLSAVLESMTDGVIVTDRTGEVCFANEAAHRLLGAESGDTLSRKYLKERLGFYPFDLVGGDDEIVREELRLGDQRLHSLVAPVRDEQGQRVGSMVVLRDRHEWQELERRKDEFVAAVSHALRTPLSSVTGAVDIVLADPVAGLGRKQRRYLEVAKESCLRLNQIVEDLLDVAQGDDRTVGLALSQVTLDSLAQECTERFRPEAEGRNVKLEFKAQTLGIRIVADSDKLAQVMVNLLSNALRYCRDDGTGKIEVEVFGPGVASSHVGVSVWNNGQTIGDASRVFLPPEEGRRISGTGLGLPVSRAIIEAHGGRLWAEQPDDGARFVFTLPSAPEVGARQVASTAPARVRTSTGSEFMVLPDEPAPTGRKVIIVDPGRHAGYLLKGVLMADQHQVFLTDDGESCLKMAREIHPDLVVIDSPGLDPGSLAEILRHDPETRSAALLLLGTPKELEALRGIRVDLLLPRPFDPDQFRATCAKLLRDRGRGSTARILIVEDDESIRMVTREVLESAGYIVREASNGIDAISEARAFRPDLLLLDIMMPDLDGFETARRLRIEPITEMTPIIFVSARSQTADKVRAFKMGADDYVVKPVDNAELLARVQKALERRNRELGASPTTMLPGANVIETEVDRRIAKNENVAFCYLDLDNLKAFNDYYGYAKADGVIRQVGDLVRECVAKHGGQGAFVGHIAGDDFVFFVSTDTVDAVCKAICTRFDELLPLYYNPADRARGYIETFDRFGELRRFPLMTVSVAALSQHQGHYQSFSALSLAAAEAKQQAKAVNGTSYVRDGRVVLPTSPVPVPSLDAVVPAARAVSVDPDATLATIAPTIK